MRVRCPAVHWVLTTVVSLADLLGPVTAAAQEEGTSATASPGHDSNPGDSPNAAAGTHFRRGVQLYNEADYAGALVEFKRAYSISPTSTALYNVGEAQFQLQDYAGALKSFQRFLAESGPSESHRGEVERSVEILRTRVGRVTVSTVPPGADIAVDDHFVGKTPLNEPLLVSVGRRKLVASMSGRAPVVSYVDVAAEDEIPLKLELAPPTAPTSVVATPPESDIPHASSPSPHGAALPIAGFVFTGALAAGAATFGVLALEEANTLKNARNAFPAAPATVTHDANLTTTFSILADSLGASAIVVGVVSLIATLSSAGTDGSKSSSASAAGVVLGPASARLEVTF